MARRVALNNAASTPAERIHELIEMAVALMEPFLSTGTATPPDIQAQVDSLAAEAETLVAVDPVDDELELAEGSQPRTAEEFPSYPVLYAAEILRPDDILILRGETGPFGQYSLFVPRDGELLSVSFYDPRTRRFDLIHPDPRPEAPYPLPPFGLHLLDPAALDTDADALPDLVEFVYGTDPSLDDSDGDGISDGAEVENGTNPLDGRPMKIGVVGTVEYARDGL